MGDGTGSGSHHVRTLALKHRCMHLASYAHIHGRVSACTHIYKICITATRAPVVVHVAHDLACDARPAPISAAAVLEMVEWEIIYVRAK